MSNLVTFNFKDNQVRTTTIDGEAWFCLLDCRAALGIKGSLKKVSLSEKGVRKTYTLTNGGKQEVNYINEPNLYRLIFRSNKPQAQAFADWVYSEVLPSIRKTGGYGVPAAPALPTADAELKDWCASVLALSIENRVKKAVEAERARILEQIKAIAG